KALKTVTLGNHLVTIGTRAFQYCTSLANLTLPASLITIGDWAFEGDTALTSIVIPDKVKDLNQGAFAYCTGLESVQIGNTVATVSGTPYDYTSPESYSGFKGYGAFYGCTSLTSVTFGTSVTAIGNGAFYGCGALRSIKIPDTVTTIGNYAFGNCQSLIYATLGKGVATMGKNVFNGDKALHYVEFKGAAAPAYNGGNTFANTNDRVKTYVQAGSTGWISLYESGLPDSWQGKAIAYGPVPSGAANPYDFYVGEGNKHFAGGVPMIVTNKRYDANSWSPHNATDEVMYDDETVYVSYLFNEYYRGEPWTVTNKFTLSGPQTAAFTTTLTAGAHATYSGWWHTNFVAAALQNLKPGKYTLTLQLNSDNRYAETRKDNNSCSVSFTIKEAPALTVTLDANGGTFGGGASFITVKRSSRIGDLPIPSRPGYYFAGWYTSRYSGEPVSPNDRIYESGSLYARWTSISWKTQTTANGVVIKGYSVPGYWDYTPSTLTIPATIGSKNVIGIADYAFFGDENLVSVIIPATVANVGVKAFKNCASLRSVTFAPRAGKALNISQAAFQGCSSLETVDIPKGVTYMWSNMFEDCPALESVTIPEGVTAIGASCFANCKALKEVTIPASVGEIRGFVFFSCESLSKVSFAKGCKVSKFGEKAFKNCTSLEAFTIPSTVRELGKAAFFNTGLVEATVPGNVVQLGDYCYQKCAALKKITLAEGVGAIGKSCFANDGALEYIAIPDSLTTLGGYAFFRCASLSTINMTDGASVKLSSIGEKAFKHCASLKTLTLPKAITTIPREMCNYCTTLEKVTARGAIKEVEQSAFSNCPKLKEVTGLTAAELALVKSGRALKK
ncbi:MAG: leucine-rich repeat protein, partial [Kiritimatiellae bacterium]|nr:leucine-rich repeat protein [Kiritimatiellia bacterium]